MAVAAGAGDIPATATDDDDKPNMLRAGSADLLPDVLDVDQGPDGADLSVLRAL